ncbi:ent-kaurene oxidase, partial [Colletotrichum asianum]
MSTAKFSRLLKDTFRPSPEERLIPNSLILCSYALSICHSYLYSKWHRRILTSFEAKNR